MLKKLIVIEGENHIQCDTEKELVRELVDERYYELSPNDKLKKLKIKALANSINRPMEILELKDIKIETDLKNKFVLLNAKTYILSLLRTGNITLLERIDSDIYTKFLDKKRFEKNYIIVNNFADDIIEKYVRNLLSSGNKER